MAATLSDKTIDLVKATVPALETHGLAITQRMYARMFENPDIRDLFNQSHHGETARSQGARGGRDRLCRATSTTSARSPRGWSASRKSTSG